MLGLQTVITVYDGIRYPCLGRQVNDKAFQGNAYKSRSQRWIGDDKREHFKQKHTFKGPGRGKKEL